MDDAAKGESRLQSGVVFGLIFAIDVTQAHRMFNLSFSFI